MNRKQVHEDRRLRAGLLLGALAAVAVSLALVLFTEERRTRTEVVALGAVFVVLALLIGLGIVAILREWRPIEPPASYQTRRFELAQWHRWRNSLYLWPVFLTVYGVLAEMNLADWLRDRAEWSRLTFPIAFLLLSAAFAGSIIIGPRGRPGTSERRNFERLNDELTLAHAGIAYRYGFFAACLGFAAIAATALLAPQGVFFAVIGACWLASVTTLVRFGLLQRAAEPTSDEA